MEQNFERKSLIGQLNGFETNVGNNERIASTVAGGALVAFGIKQGGLLGIGLSLFGGGLLVRGTTGHCGVYRALDVNTTGEDNSGSPYGKGRSGKIHVSKSVTINKSQDELYEFWRNPENLPQFMSHLESVKRIDNKRSHWKAKAPFGSSVEWEAEITSDQQNERIGWQSVENSDVPNSGVVEFLPTSNRGTEVRVTLTYEPPAGKIGSLIAKLFGEEPGQQVEDDLRHFKQLMESGTITTIEGQTSGREARSASA
jgi:uncharacterized membrane protein